MRAGRLRHRVTIRNLVETQSTITGQMAQSWSTLSTAVWASIDPITSRSYKEQFVAQQHLSQIDCVITVRYLSGISVKGKVINGSAEYNIEAIFDTEERNRELQLMCSRVTT